MTVFRKPADHQLYTEIEPNVCENSVYDRWLYKSTGKGGINQQIKMRKWVGKNLGLL